MTKYNLGACHVRRHEYEQALDCLEHVLELAPKSQKAREKAMRIRHKLAREV
ncbi:MAG: tetratricopeptide repeat protein [Candidatus Hydrogenedentota bacterium]